MSFNQIVVLSEFFSWPLFLTPEIAMRWECFVCLNKISNGREEEEEEEGESRGLQHTVPSRTRHLFICGSLMQDTLMEP